jgi:hypothetical protein
MSRRDEDEDRPEDSFWQWFGLIVLLACWVGEAAIR